MKFDLLLAMVAVLPAAASILSEDYYERLGVSRDATKREIRVAFKQLAMENHPDANPSDSDANTKMVELNQAFFILSNGDDRNAYDNKALDDNHSNLQKFSSFQDLAFYEKFGLFDADPQIATMDYRSWEASHSSEENWFLVLHSASCEHCHLVADDIRELGKRLQDVVHIATVNCDDSWPVCRDIGVRVLPTGVLYTSGKGLRSRQVPMVLPGNTPEDFQVDALEKWILDAVPSSSRELGAQDFTPGNPVPYAGAKGEQWLVGYCSGQEESCVNLSNKLKQVSNILGGLCRVGQVDCSRAPAACAQHPVGGGSFMTAYLNNPGQEPERFELETKSREIAHKIVLGLPKLRELTVRELSQIARLVLHPDSKERASKSPNARGAKPKEYLILFTKQSTCDHSTPELGMGSSKCYRSTVAFRRVGLQIANKALVDDDYLDLNVVTFDCHIETQSRDDEARKLCEALDVAHGQPEILLLKDGGMAANTYHDSIRHDNEIMSFVVEDFRSVCHEMSVADFETHVLREKQTWFMDFYAPWCHHCRDVYPEWNAATKHYDTPKNVHWGKLNCDEHHEACVQQGIRGYPTFILYKDGEKIMYDMDHRTAEEFVRFIKLHLEDVVVDFNTISFSRNVNDVAKQGGVTNPDDAVDEVWVVFFHGPDCDAECEAQKETFEGAATAMRGVVRFGQVDCSGIAQVALCSENGVSEFPTIYRYDGSPYKRSNPKSYTGFKVSASDTGVFGMDIQVQNMLSFITEDLPDYVEQLSASRINEVVAKQEAESQVSWVFLYTSSKDCPTCAESVLVTKALAARYTARFLDQRTKVTRRDPVAATRVVELKFGIIDCRASGVEYSACLKHKVRRFPTIVYKSGCSDNVDNLGSLEPLALISAIDRNMADDRQTLANPFADQPTFHYHDEL